jgi:hypothetical protein
MTDSQWQKLVRAGADLLIEKAGELSKHDNRTAIPQLLVAAACIARLTHISESGFRHGCELAIRDVYDAPLIHKRFAPSTTTKQ